MRVVQYTNHSKQPGRELMFSIAVIAGIFSAVVCVLMILNAVRLKQADPVHSPALIRLLEELKANPDDEALREQIRELDFLARKAYFTSERFNRLGVWLLLAGLTVMIAGFKRRAQSRRVIPFPGSDSARDDLSALGRWARRFIAGAGIVLAAFALSISLPWRSPLESSVEESAMTAPPVSTSGASDIPAPPFAAREEFERQWPFFRGAAGAVAGVETAPIQWNAETGEGIQWKLEIPLPGFSSPIVWEDRVFLTGGAETEQEVYCVGATTGNLLWRHRVSGVEGSPAKPPRVNSETGYAAATPATDGRRVFAIFATGDLAALDDQGNQVWARNLGVPKNAYGHSSSLVIHEDRLLVQFDHEESGRLFGIETDTGKIAWTVQRDLGPCWASPLLVDAGGRVEAILASGNEIISYDPKTGDEYWRAAALDDGETAPSPAYANGRVFVSADYVKFAAIDVQTQSILWENFDYIPGVASPLAVEDYVIFGHADGGFGCLDAATGKLLWHQETDEGFYASPILAGNRVYLIDRGGTTHHFQLSGDAPAVTQCPLDELAVATPALAEGNLYIRTAQHLYRIGE